MRKQLTITIGALFLVLLCIPSYGQILDGVYKCGEQRLTIIGDHIEYKLISFGCCIHTSYSGTGKIALIEKRLFITPDNIEAPKQSTIKWSDSSKKDTMSIFISGDEPNQVAISFFRKNREVLSTMTDLNKTCLIPRTKIMNCDSVIVSFIGYRPVGCKIDIEKSLDIHVNLYPYENDDFHYEFITNEGKGFEIKIESDRILLKYNRRMKRHNANPKTKYHIFDKINKNAT